MLHAVCPTPYYYYYLKARKATTWKWCISDPKFEKAKHILVIEQFSIFCKQTAEKANKVLCYKGHFAFTNIG